MTNRIRNKTPFKIMKLSLWLNQFGNMEKHSYCYHLGKITEFGEGYKQAMIDVFDFIDANEYIQAKIREEKEIRKKELRNRKDVSQWQTTLM